MSNSPLTEYHHGNLGRFAPVGAVQTTDGYIQLPGSTFDADRYAFGSENLEDPDTLAYYRDDWFPMILTDNAHYTKLAEAELAAWQD